ncbi:MAG: sigma-70 family RNA polymerase sigma factor [Acidobacteria bacterium]|nr:MAG: sigma-70 family RNA polymerase sigma factor [Acidobacteriota bacterium]
MQQEAPTNEVTLLLRAWGDGDAEALERLAPLVYQELHRIARGYMGRERPDHTLQTTALINEAYVRLVDVRRVNWQDRAHFFAVCARAMRRILVDHARSRGYQKRGGGNLRVQFEEASGIAWSPDPDLLQLDEALNRLSALDPRKGSVIEMRFFGGLSVEETAEALKISPETVMRDWKLARAWLYRELSADPGNGD